MVIFMTDIEAIQSVIIGKYVAGGQHQRLPGIPVSQRLDVVPVDDRFPQSVRRFDDEHAWSKQLPVDRTHNTFLTAFDVDLEEIDGPALAVCPNFGWCDGLDII